MAIAHRDGDERACGAVTIVTGQHGFFINGKLFSVDGDPDSHGDGALKTSHPGFTINGKGVIVVGDGASEDDLCPIAGGAHCDPDATSGVSGFVVL